MIKIPLLSYTLQYNWYWIFWIYISSFRLIRYYLYCFLNVNMSSEFINHKIENMMNLKFLRGWKKWNFGAQYCFQNIFISMDKHNPLYKHFYGNASCAPSNKNIFELWIKFLFDHTFKVYFDIHVLCNTTISINLLVRFQEISTWPWFF